MEWTHGSRVVQRHSKAPRAAGVIHTDFERGFICAEVCTRIHFFHPYLELSGHDVRGL